jgi:hypothetical protein
MQPSGQIGQLERGAGENEERSIKDVNKVNNSPIPVRQALEVGNKPLVPSPSESATNGGRVWVGLRDRRVDVSIR